jgi:hypothetical protein
MNTMKTIGMRLGATVEAIRQGDAGRRLDVRGLFLLLL